MCQVLFSALGYSSDQSHIKFLLSYILWERQIINKSISMSGSDNSIKNINLKSKVRDTNK